MKKLIVPALAGLSVILLLAACKKQAVESQNVSEKSNCAGIIAADILSAGEGGILPSGPTLDFPRFSNLSAGSAGLEAPALRQAGKPAATFFRHALMR